MSQPMQPPKALHFLVVDDNDDVRKTVVEYLRAFGYDKISQCTDGSEALRMMERDPTINFVISDWEMPLMNGITFLQRLKTNPYRSHVPFLMMTSPSSDESGKVILAAESLVDAYLIKPFRGDMLRDKIEKVLQNPARGPQKQVVVVDDDADAREIVVEYIKQMGFKEVVDFQEGKAALSYLAQNYSKVGLIVSDWEMPEMSGIDLLKACKERKQVSEIPFLMITSQSSIERMKVMQAAREQVDQYLLKPFSGDEIKKRIESLLERARFHKEVRGFSDQAVEELQHGRYSKAADMFERALKLDPEYDVALRGLGESLLKTKGVEAALPSLKKAVEVNPHNPKGHLLLSLGYEQSGLLDKAVQVLIAANRQINFNAELHFHLGRLYKKKGNPRQARAEFEAVLQIEADHGEAKMMLAVLQDDTKPGSKG